MTYSFFKNLENPNPKIWKIQIKKFGKSKSKNLENKNYNNKKYYYKILY